MFGPNPVESHGIELGDSRVPPHAPGALRPTLVAAAAGIEHLIVLIDIGTHDEVYA